MARPSWWSPPTKNGAIANEALDEYGMLGAGKAADVIILEADPLTDIANIRPPSIVIKSGRTVDIDALATNPHRPRLGRRNAGRVALTAHRVDTSSSPPFRGLRSRSIRRLFGSSPKLKPQTSSWCRAEDSTRNKMVGANHNVAFKVRGRDWPPATGLQATRRLLHAAGGRALSRVMGLGGNR